MKHAEINQKDLARRIDLTPQRIRKLHNEGAPHRRDGREVLYPWPRFRDWYADYKEGEERVRAESAGGGQSEKEARARKTAAQAKLAELELAKAQGELIPLRIHEQVVEQLAERLVGALKNLPSAWAQQLTAIDETRDVAKVLHAVSTELIEDLRSVLDEDLDDATA